jgi:hypothetical protein
LRRRVHWYRGILPFRRLEFLGSGEPANESICSNHLNVLAEKGREAIVAERFVDAINRDAFGAWDEVVLPMMDGDGPMPGLLAARFRSAGVDAEICAIAYAPYIELSDGWESYLRSLPKKHRKKIRHSLNGFDEWSGGAWRLECISGPDDLERGKQILRELHRHRWAQFGTPGVFEAKVAHAVNVNPHGRGLGARLVHMPDPESHPSTLNALCVAQRLPSSPAM